MAHESLSEYDYNENKTDLIDCYRVALDFGLPAAQRALERLAVSLPQQTHLKDKLAKYSYKTSD